MEEYLNQKSVQDALGVPAGIDWVSCSTSVYNAMIDDWVRNLEVSIPSLLEDGIRVLIYAGEYDLICNWLGKPGTIEIYTYNEVHTCILSFKQVLIKTNFPDFLALNNLQ